MEILPLAFPFNAAGVLSSDKHLINTQINTHIWHMTPFRGNKISILFFFYLFSQNLFLCIYQNNREIKVIMKQCCITVAYDAFIQHQINFVAVKSIVQSGAQVISEQGFIIWYQSDFWLHFQISSWKYQAINGLQSVS